MTRRTGQSTNRLACRRTRRCGTLFDAAKGIPVNVEFYNAQPTASAAVYPQQLCKAILKDVKKFIAAQERASHLVCHKCSKCKLGRVLEPSTHRENATQTHLTATSHIFSIFWHHSTRAPRSDNPSPKQMRKSTEKSVEEGEPRRGHHQRPRWYGVQRHQHGHAEDARDWPGRKQKGKQKNHKTHFISRSADPSSESR